MDDINYIIPRCKDEKERQLRRAQARKRYCLKTKDKTKEYNKQYYQKTKKERKIKRERKIKESVIKTLREQGIIDNNNDLI
jgi:hypothetical protein